MKIQKAREYVVDTSVVMSSAGKYPEETVEESAMSLDELEQARDKCFDVLLRLSNSIIAVDSEKMIFDEYDEQVFKKFPKEFPTQWYNRMLAADLIKEKDVSAEKVHISFLKGQYDLSRTDCQFVFTAAETDMKDLIHRDQHYRNAAGYIRQHFDVEQYHILKTDIKSVRQ